MPAPDMDKQEFPLLLNFTMTVFGRGFVAEVAASGGRLLATQDGDEWWLYGVHPGAVAASGETLEVAHQAMRESLQRITVNFANEALNFKLFKTEVERFFMTENEPTGKEWRVAYQRTRETNLQIQSLPVWPATQPNVLVTEKTAQQVRPADNIVSADVALPKVA